MLLTSLRPGVEAGEAGQHWTLGRLASQIKPGATRPWGRVRSRKEALASGLGPTEEVWSHIPAPATEAGAGPAPAPPTALCPTLAVPWDMVRFAPWSLLQKRPLLNGPP